MAHDDTTAREILAGLKELEDKVTSSTQFRALRFSKLLVCREYPELNRIISDTPEPKDTSHE